MLVCGLFSSAPIHAEGTWFTDPDTGCKVYGKQEQPIVSVHWSGDCVDGRASGQGVLRVLIDSVPFSTYEGELVDGKASGKGILTSPDGSRYEGEFLNNEMHGQGAIISSDGKRLEGTYKHGLPHGTMTVVTPDGNRRQMLFENGRRIR